MGTSPLSPYTFLNAGGLRSLVNNSIWKGDCPLKIKIFNWLALDNKILTLDNLARRGCNSISTFTCVLCYTAIETAYHLLLNCPFASRIWSHYSALFNVPNMATTLEEIWTLWANNRSITYFGLGNLLIQAIWWNFWLEWNYLIFSCMALALQLSSIFKIDHILIAWLNATPKSQKTTLEEALLTIKRSFEFVGPLISAPGELSTSSS